MKTTNIKLLLISLGALAAGSANATLIDGIVDQWTVGVNTVFNTLTICDSAGICGQPNGVTVLNNKSLRWGTPGIPPSGQSGLDISNSPTAGTVFTNGAPVANVSITHLNRPIDGTTLRSVDINSTLTLTPLVPPGSSLPPQTITFPVHYLETNNSDSTCPDGGANGVGVNVNGCADIYVTDNTSLNFPFFYDMDGAGPLPNQEYFISFFENTGGMNSLSAAACAAVGQPFPCLGFETPEQADTTVQFASLITTDRIVINVPEPGTLALLGLSLGALGFSLRRKV